MRPPDLTAALEKAEAALAQRLAAKARQPRGDTSWHQEAERRYRAGETLREVGTALGCGKDRVREALLARGVPMRSGGGNGKRSAEEMRESGRKGGIACAARHGHEFYVTIGRKGRSQCPKRP